MSCDHTRRTYREKRRPYWAGWYNYKPPLAVLLLFFVVCSIPSSAAQNNTACIVAGNIVWTGDFITTNCSVNTTTTLCELSAEIAAETAYRISNDTGLQNQIILLNAALVTEQEERISADSVLQGEIDTETSIRQSNVAILQGEIDGLQNGTYSFSQCNVSSCGMNAMIQSIIAQNGTFVTIAGTQTITGPKTIESPLTLTSTTAHLIIQPGTNTSEYYNITAIPPTQDTSILLQDPGAPVVSFVLTNGTYTMYGSYTFYPCNQTVCGLSTGLNLETIFRISNDTYLQGQIDQIIPYLGNGTVIDNPCRQSLCGIYSLVQSLIGENSTWVTLTTAQLITGHKSFGAPVDFQSTADQMVFQPGGTGHTSTINVVQPSTSDWTTTLIDPGANVEFLLTASPTGQTVSNFITFTGTPQFAAAGPIQFELVDFTSGNSLAITIGTLSSNWHAAFVDPGGNTANFMMTETAAPQIVGASTTFTTTLTLSAASDQFIIWPGGSGFMYTINATNPGQDTLVSFPDPGVVSTYFVLSNGAQSLAGPFTFTTDTTFSAATAATFSSASPSLQFGTSSHLLTITFNAIASSTQAYTVIDVATAANFVMSAGLQILTATYELTAATPLLFTASAPSFEYGATGHVLTVTYNAIAASTQAYTVIDVATAANFVMSAGTQTLTGTYTFTVDTTFSASTAATFSSASPSLQFGTSSHLLTVTYDAIAASTQAYTVIDVATAANFVMSAGTQTLTGTYTFTIGTTFSASTAAIFSAASPSLQFGTSSHLLTVTYDAIAASAQAYTVIDVATAASFVMSAGTQTLSATFTLSAATTTFSAAAPNLAFGTASHLLTINFNAIAASTQLYSVIDVATAANFVMSAGTQTLTGTYTFTVDTTFSAATAATFSSAAPALKFGATGHVLTVTYNAIAASTQAYTVIDVATAANFVMSAGVQTLSAAYTLSSSLTLSGGTTGIVFANGNNPTLDTWDVLNTYASSFTCGSGTSSSVTIPVRRIRGGSGVTGGGLVCITIPSFSATCTGTSEFVSNTVVGGVGASQYWPAATQMCPAFVVNGASFQAQMGSYAITTSGQIILYATGGSGTFGTSGASGANSEQTCCWPL